MCASLCTHISVWSSRADGMGATLSGEKASADEEHIAEQIREEILNTVQSVNLVNV